MTAFTETYRPQSETYGSDAFRLEYSHDTPAVAIQKDIESFLGEYVFHLPLYDYQLVFDGQSLLDPHTGESMVGKNIKAINRRRGDGKNTNREKAELEGFLSLEQQLQKACNGDSVVWISPPGKPEKEYGDYGFVFIGMVEEEGLKMTAVRVESPDFGEFQEFSKEIGAEAYSLVEDFLAHPLVLSNLTQTQIRTLAEKSFTIKNASETKVFLKTIDALAPYINRFINAVQQNQHASFQQQIVNTILNSAIKLRDRSGLLNEDAYLLSFNRAFSYYGKIAPILTGSCGNTSNIFNKLSQLNQLFTESSHYSDYECPHCRKVLSGESKTDEGSWRKKCDHCGGSLNC